jgi:hypothetical protein
MKTIKIIAGVITLLIIAIIILFKVNPPKDLNEFKITESIKGEWIIMIDYEKEYKRFPSTIEEFEKYYGNKIKDLPFIYTPPIDPNKDEVILWWKEIPRSGNKIGITEAGTIIKTEA